MMLILTKIIFQASDFFQGSWQVFFILPLPLAAAYIAVKDKPAFRSSLDKMQIRLPVFKQVFYNKLMAIFAEQSMILSAAGITVDKSLLITSDVIGNEMFKEAILNVREEVIGGGTITEAMEKEDIFPDAAIRMIDIGEKTGTLEKQYAFLADYYLKRLDEVSQKMGALIEPFVIAFIGLLFAVIIMGLMMPIYDLLSGI